MAKLAEGAVSFSQSGCAFSTPPEVACHLRTVEVDRALRARWVALAGGAVPLKSGCAIPTHSESAFHLIARLCTLFQLCLSQMGTVISKFPGAGVLASALAHEKNQGIAQTAYRFS